MFRGVVAPRSCTRGGPASGSLLPAPLRFPPESIPGRPRAVPRRFPVEFSYYGEGIGRGP